MPLSEHEQKLLDQMERALYAEDPRFASHMKGRATAPSRRRLFIGVGVALAGLAVVIAAVTTQIIPLGVVGFVLMVAGVAYAATPTRKNGQATTTGTTTQGPTQPRRPGKKGSVLPEAARSHSGWSSAGRSAAKTARTCDEDSRKPRESSHRVTRPLGGRLHRSRPHRSPDVDKRRPRAIGAARCATAPSQW